MSADARAADAADVARFLEAFKDALENPEGGRGKRSGRCDVKVSEGEEGDLYDGTIIFVNSQSISHSSSAST